MTASCKDQGKIVDFEKNAMVQQLMIVTLALIFGEAIK